MEMAANTQTSRKVGSGSHPETVAPPSPLEGVGGALRAVFGRATNDLPPEFRTLLDKLR